MKTGINAMNQRWLGAMVKRTFFNAAEDHGDFSEALTVQYLGVSHERAAKVYHYGEHQHVTHEVLFIEKGRYICEVNGGGLTLKAGDVVIIGPGDRHSDVCRPPLEYYAMWFSLSPAGGDRQIHILRDGLDPAGHVFSAERGLFTEKLKAILREAQQGGRFSLLLQQAMAQEIIWRLMDAVQQDNLNPLLLAHTQDTELLAKLTRIFDENLSKPLTVDGMADALGMSASTLAHACTNLLGIGPARAFMRYRIEKSMHMLRCSSMSVKEIAAGLGFHDASHFIHTFSRERGTTPAKFRSTDSVTSVPNLSAQVV